MSMDTLALADCVMAFHAQPAGDVQQVRLLGRRVRERRLAHSRHLARDRAAELDPGAPLGDEQPDQLPVRDQRYRDLAGRRYGRQDYHYRCVTRRSAR